MEKKSYNIFHNQFFNTKLKTIKLTTKIYQNTYMIFMKMTKKVWQDQTEEDGTQNHLI